MNEGTLRDAVNRVQELDGEIEDAENAIIFRRQAHAQLAATFMASDPRRNNAKLWEILLLEEELESVLRQRQWVLTQVGRLEQDL